VRRDRLKTHMSEAHGGVRQPNVTDSRSGREQRRSALQQEDVVGGRSLKEGQLVRCKTCGVFVESVLLDSHECKERSHSADQPETGSRLILFSERYKKLRGGGRCSECGFRDDVVWCYRESNQGTVQLCRECRPKVLDRSFGEVDAMNRAWISAFETNRRRH
jgi:hypothetical protein